MQIITLDHEIFPDLLDAFHGSKCVGHFWKAGKLRTVSASSQFLIISSEKNTDKLAYKPTRSFEEAVAMALQVLNREEKRGNQVERQADYK